MRIVVALGGNAPLAKDHGRPATIGALDEVAAVLAGSAGTTVTSGGRHRHSA